MSGNRTSSNRASIAINYGLSRGLETICRLPYGDSAMMGGDLLKIDRIADQLVQEYFLLRGPRCYKMQANSFGCFALGI